jgi:photosystem II stability/assembly factor-like uncharacterized protein
MNTLKIIALTVLFVTAYIMPLKSQSTYEFGIKFANDTTATLVGADGVILNTKDGGLTWDQQESNTTNVLYCIDITYKIYSMDSPQRIPIGISVGENGILLRTINGGYTWNTLESGTLNHLRGVSSTIATQSVIICGDSGTVLYSNNAGETFTPEISQTSVNLYAVGYSPDVVMVSRLEARVVLIVGDLGTVLLSNDDGITWTPLSSGIAANFRAVSWADPYTAIVVGEGGAIYNTTDRGTTWSPTKTNFSCNFYGVKYLDSTTIVAVGDNGTIARSTDRGMTFTTIQSNTQNSIMSVNFANVDKGIAVGEASTTLYTNDGGQTWSGQSKLQKNTASPVSSCRKTFSLAQNYPNPFNPGTTISYNLPADSKVSLRVFDLTGKEVAELVNGLQTQGSHSVNFNAKNLSSGIYFYRITAGNYNEVKKMILVK